MNLRRPWCGVLVAAALPCASRADELLTVTPASVVAFGRDGGDTFGLQRLSRDTVIVLVRPRGEVCTLRFPLNVGESLLLRATASDGQPLVCKASLVSVVEGSSAEFSYRCSIEAS